MSLHLPVLDDTDFEQLLQMALARIDDRLDVKWRAASESDPGRVLIELFAYLTDQMIYRLNRLPKKVYIAFLRLLDTRLHPPIAAQARLAFTPLPREIPAGTEQSIEVPRGTRIITGEGGDESELPVFVTLDPLEVPLLGADATESDLAGSTRTMDARHCTWVEQEFLGTGTGKPGLQIPVAHPPIVAPFHPEFALAVWVQDDGPAGADDTAVRTIEGRRYRKWQEVTSFLQPSVSREVYTVDRLSGIIRFAPAAMLDIEAGEPEALATVPGKDKQILVQYAHGGGARGNVPAGALAKILDPVRLIKKVTDDEPVYTEVAPDAYLTLTNPERARGGQDAETLDNALLRGPQVLYTQEQVVTPRDYARVVLQASHGAIHRAFAHTKRSLWTYARPGTVEILWVPASPPEATSTPDNGAVSPDAGAASELLRQVSLEDLLQWAADVDTASIGRTLTRNQAMGTRHEFKGAHYKGVQVKATISIDTQEAAPSVVEANVLRRLHQFINPFNDPDTVGMTVEDRGWPFGRELSFDEIEEIIESTPGVVKASELELHFDAPNTDVYDLVPDKHQPRTWYASSDNCLYRSTNAGLGWERMQDFDGEVIRVIRPSPDHDGLLALVTHVVDPEQPPKSRVYVSLNCGDSWTKVTDFNGRVEDMDWLLRANLTMLLLATDRGLYEFELKHALGEKPYLDVPSLVPVSPDDIKAPLYALTVIRGQRGLAWVAVALKSRGGVFISDGADLTMGQTSVLSQDEADGTSIDTLFGAPPVPMQSSQDAQLSQSAGEWGTRFRQVPGLDGEDVRHLTAQQVGIQRFLWAGVMAEGNEANGCYRWQLGQAMGTWYRDGWTGGSCRALAFDGAQVFAATQWGGILKLDLSLGEDAVWRTSFQEDTKFEPSIPKSFERFASDQRPDYEKERAYKPLWNVAVGEDGTLMTGGRYGILRLVRFEDLHVGSGITPEDVGDLYEESSAAVVTNRSYRDRITLPYDGLFVSGDHAVVRSRADQNEE